MAVMAPSLLRPNRLAHRFRRAQPPHASTTYTYSSPSTTALHAPKPVVPAAASGLPKKKVLVPVARGTEEMEAVILVDVLRRSGADVLMASVEKELEVEGSSRTRLVADTLIAPCASEVFDLVAIPGGMPGSARLRDCEILKSITSKQAEQKRLYGAICAAPAVVLESWALMRRKQMTCHPAFMHKLPTFRAVKSNIQVSGELTTSRGPGTSYEFALSFVRQLFGDAHADEVERQLLMECHGDHRREEFNRIDWSFNDIPRVLIPIANGSEEMEMVTIVDILRRAKVNVVVASVENSIEIVASRSTKIVADVIIDSIVDSVFDMIILPGGVTGSARLQKSKILKRLLKEQKSGGRIYGAVCSSPAILQKHGLLMNKRVTAHPSVIGKLNGQVVDGASFIIDGELITSRGLSTVTDFSLAIVSKLFGHARARSVAEGLVFEYPRSKGWTLVGA